ncbi:odorant receptor Or2-like [Schistocerca piceifrons]|uniref:odorant receptor Or2-like n=1 Tax=Schistocerca piceifrons TaxID=274613 RepID=UPI001F5FA703|nr:odorant receptor Or2-like [Schistocerca piceifrons]
MVVVPTTLWLLDPLVGAGSSARRLPMPMWVPAGLRSSPGHQILYAFQALAMITVVEASLYLDVCFVVLMLSVSAELHVLNDAVASINAPAVLGEQLTASAFSGDWPAGDARMRKALLVLMLRSSRPLKLTVGKLYVLSRHTFLQILNGSYTLFNMLYQVQTKK